MTIWVNSLFVLGSYLQLWHFGYVTVMKERSVFGMQTELSSSEEATNMRLSMPGAWIKTCSEEQFAREMINH